MTVTTPTRRRRAAFAAVLLGGTALGGFAWFADPSLAQPAPPAAQTATTLGPIAPPAASLPGFADLAARVGPAVVTITSTERAPARAGSPFEPGSGQDDMFRRYFGGRQGGQGEQGEEQGTGRQSQGRPGTPPRPMRALGSGFVVDAEGHIITNNHVVNGASSVTVTLEDGRELPARIVGRDPRTDLAVLKVEAGAPLPYLQLGDSDRARPGDWVVAIGNPFGLGGTVTAGIVSARSRDIGSGPYDDFLQVDAPINRGNSGGPLFALDGTVIGVNTAILSPTGGSIGIGFAIPSNLVRNVVAQLEQTGRMERGWLGVSTQRIDPAMAAALRLPNAQGALIAEAQPDSPAARGGLQSGDVVTALDGTVVRTPRDLARLVANLRPGASATFTVRRQGAEQSLRITVAQLQDEGGKVIAAAARPDDRGGRPAEREAAQRGIGVALAPIDKAMRAQLNLPGDVTGAMVAEVRPDSPAEAAGLRRGDVIRGVGDQSVADARAAATSIRQALRDNHAVALRIVRDGHTLFVAVRPAADAPATTTEPG